MQLLASIIHHADAMQSQFAPPSSSSVEEESKTTESLSSTYMIKSLTHINSSTATTNTIKAMNEKAYKRWQHILQEGLVPMAVRGLGLLEPIIVDNETGGKTNKCPWELEEEEYFQSLEGMEEEIQMMAILGRAASLRDRTVNDSEVEKYKDSNDDENENGMDQINSMMKCTAMLMFHVVMMASTPSTQDSGDVADKSSSGNNSNGTTTTTTKAAGYDGRVRHVLKMSCVDGLTRAILKSVETYEKNEATEETSDENDGVQTPTEPKLYDVDEYTLWNIPNIKLFLDEHTIGKEAIFGTMWNKKSSDIFGLLGKKHGSKPELGPQEQTGIEKQQSDTKLDEMTSDQQEVVESEEFPSIDEMHSDLLLTDEMEDNEDISPADNISNDATENHKAQSPDHEMDEILDTAASAVQTETVENDSDGGDRNTKQSNDDDIGDEQPDACENDTADSHEMQPQTINKSSDSNENIVDTTESPQEQELKRQQDEAEAHLAKRQLNAKFLASRKFELIERIIAIDVVRFLMAEERERKLREKEQKEQKNKFMNVVEMIKKATEDGGEKCVDGSVSGDIASDEANDEKVSNQNAADAPSENSAEYWTSHRKKQVLRSLKIAGVGLT